MEWEGKRNIGEEREVWSGVGAVSRGGGGAQGIIINKDV